MCRDPLRPSNQSSWDFVFVLFFLTWLCVSALYVSTKLSWLLLGSFLAAVVTPECRKTGSRNPHEVPKLQRRQMLYVCTLLSNRASFCYRDNRQILVMLLFITRLNVICTCNRLHSQLKKTLNKGFYYSGLSQRVNLTPSIYSNLQG